MTDVSSQIEPVADGTHRNGDFVVVVRVVAAVFSCAILSWFLFGNLGGWMLPQSPLATYTIEVVPPEGVQPQASNDNVLITQIVADNRKLTGAECTLQGNWKLLYNSTCFEHSMRTPGSLAFQARVAVIHFYVGWASRAVIRQGAQIVETVDRSTKGTGPTALVCPGDFTVPKWFVALCVIIPLLALAVLRPWRNSQRMFAWLIAWLVAIHLTVWLAQPIGINEDCAGYLQSWQANVNGLPAYFPPGYGAFLAFASAAHALPAAPVAGLLQHAMALLTAVWLAVLLRQVIPHLLSELWLVALPLLAPAVIVPQCLLSENLAQFGMAGALYFAWRASQRWHWRFWVSSGLLLGVAGLARVIPLVAGLSVFILLLIPRRPGRSLIRTMLIAVITVGSLLLPMFWFAIRSHQFSLTTSVGRHLFDRVVYEQKLLNEQGPTVREVERALPEVNLREIAHWNLSQRLKAAGFPPDQTILRIVQESLQGAGVRSFLAFSTRLAWRELFATPDRHLPFYSLVSNSHPILQDPPRLPVTPLSLAWRCHLDLLFDWCWQPVCWLAVSGALLWLFCANRTVALALLLAPAGYLFATGCTEFFLARYNAALTPFILAIAFVPFGALARVCGWRPASVGAAPALPMDIPNTAGHETAHSEGA